MIGGMAPLVDTHDPRTWRTDVAHLDGLSTAAVATDADGRVVYSNTAGQNLFGCTREQLLGHDLLELLLPQDHQGGGKEVFYRAIGGEPWHGRLPFNDPAGEERTLDVSATPLRREGLAVGVLFVMEDADTEGGASGRSQRMAARLARVARVTAELVSAEDMNAVTAEGAP